jgi:F0F1-type ATP synthase membrane subunit b/b'
MPSNGKSSTKTQTKTASTKTQTKTATTPDGTVATVRQTAERAVDVPVGAALTVRARVNEVVEPWTSSESRTKELKDLRTQVTREFNKFERRGGQARRKATQRARRTRSRVEREVIARRRAIERGVKQNRTKVERSLKKAQTSIQERVPARS